MYWAQNAFDVEQWLLLGQSKAVKLWHRGLDLGLNILQGPYQRASAA